MGATAICRRSEGLLSEDERRLIAAYVLSLSKITGGRRGMTNRAPGNRRWSMRQRDWAVVLWIAFLAAAAGAFVLFGLVNPEDMLGVWVDRFGIGVRLAYGLVFAFLYLLCLLAAALTMFMIRTGPSGGHSNGNGKRSMPKVRDPAAVNPDLEGEDWR